MNLVYRTISNFSGSDAGNTTSALSTTINLTDSDNYYYGYTFTNSGAKTVSFNRNDLRQGSTQAIAFGYNNSTGGSVTFRVNDQYQSSYAITTALSGTGTVYFTLMGMGLTGPGVKGLTSIEKLNDLI